MFSFGYNKEQFISQSFVVYYIPLQNEIQFQPYHHYITYPSGTLGIYQSPLPAEGTQHACSKAITHLWPGLSGANTKLAVSAQLLISLQLHSLPPLSEFLTGLCRSFNQTLPAKSMSLFCMKDRVVVTENPFNLVCLLRKV